MAFYQSVKVLQTFCFLNWVEENTYSKHIFFSLLSTIRLDEYHPWHFPPLSLQSHKHPKWNIENICPSIKLTNKIIVMKETWYSDDKPLQYRWFSSYVLLYLLLTSFSWYGVNYLSPLTIYCLLDSQVRKPRRLALLMLEIQDLHFESLADLVIAVHAKVVLTFILWLLWKLILLKTTKVTYS